MTVLFVLNSFSRSAEVHAEVAGQEAEYDRKAGEVSHAAEVRAHAENSWLLGWVLAYPREPQYKLLI